MSSLGKSKSSTTRRTLTMIPEITLITMGITIKMIIAMVLWYRIESDDTLFKKHCYLILDYLDYYLVVC